MVYHKNLFSSPAPFDLSQGLGNGRGYHSGSGHGGAGHSRTGECGGSSLGGFLKDVVIGGILGGLGSAGFYGAGKAVDAFHESFVGRRNSFRPVSGAVKLMGAGEGEAFGIYASKATPIEDGFNTKWICTELSYKMG